MLSLKDLKNWCDNRLELAENEDQVFVGKYEIKLRKNSAKISKNKIAQNFRRVRFFSILNDHLLHHNKHEYVLALIQLIFSHIYQVHLTIPS